ncbi:uncharacterized protein LOC131644386 [Vicia villosa]|uniref:uncharacterized protein LOC131644386 n=1 Tax=Vicia villosa TaxID=3911 RepID=UPI00273B7B98|nr:uncharacterized protein LOC131644386 [Vicia villosa]XP_058770857.1 uncharacterized protein LOC131644386 [Vicia villosa]
MGFNSVYRSLQDIFPQVDSRLLRAVAIEHPKDADIAAEIVLTEIIPSISKKLLSVTPPEDKSPRVIVNLEDESEDEGDGLALAHHKLIKSRDAGSSSSNYSSRPDLNVPVKSRQGVSPVMVINLEDESEEEGSLGQKHQLVEDNDMGSSSSTSLSSRSIPVQTAQAANSYGGLDLNMTLNESTLSNGSDKKEGSKRFFGIDLEAYLKRGFSNGISQETSNGFDFFNQGRLDVDVDSENLASSRVYQVAANEQNNLNEEWVDFVPTDENVDATFYDTSHSLEKCETALNELEGSEVQTVSQLQEHTPIGEDCLQMVINSNPSVIVGETSHIEDEIDVNKTVSQTSHIEDEIDVNKTVSQNSRACSIDTLEETIDEAKTNKKMLFSSMESLINLMREVELLEKAAEQANMLAARGGSDILDRVEEYQAMLVHAKEANDMHAGEIYGEKAILSTELKELQSRLSSLSGERDMSLAILDEMRQILESRLTAAEMLKKAAELEKEEKEGSAKMALLEQEAMMEKVVQESRRLQQEAEENSKLREFLMDRGQIVDTLQGEISVICQDIRLLKEKFDANLPLSQSFTSSQTSCILASSGSSHKTLASNAGSEHSDSSETLKITQAFNAGSEHSDSSELLKITQTSNSGSEHSDLSEILKITQAASIESLSYKGVEEEKSKSERNALLDDGWEIFDKDAELDS